MKNRRIVIAAFLCVAMLVVGVGYAALSGHLTLRGEASFNKDAAEDGFIENIVFSEAAVKDGTGGSAKTDTIVDSATANMQEASFTVKTLAVQDESVTFTYKLTNNNLVAAYIDIHAMHDDGVTPNPTTTFNHYEVTSIKIDGTEMLATDANVTLAEGATVEVEVTVDLKSTPSTELTPETYFLHLTATSVDA